MIRHSFLEGAHPTPPPLSRKECLIIGLNSGTLLIGSPMHQKNLTVLKSGHIKGFFKYENDQLSLCLGQNYM